MSVFYINKCLNRTPKEFSDTDSANNLTKLYELFSVTKGLFSTQIENIIANSKNIKIVKPGNQ